jgi:transposase-like protein
MTKAELARRMAWRCKVIQQAAERSRNIARTCRHFGISRPAYYRWKRRFDAWGTIRDLPLMEGARCVRNPHSP